LIRIALDAMGGDKAPAAPVEGALAAVERFPDLTVLLVGEPPALERELGSRGGKRPRVEIVESGPAVLMDEEPVRAMKTQPRNSARVAAELVGAGRADGVVNLGSTGAAVAAAILFGERLPGVSRPGIAVPFPRRDGATVVVDAGGSVDVRPEHLHQWAVMARHYARVTLGVAVPRVGILSVGEEEHKGNRLVKETWDLFRAHPVEGFVGNVEGRDVFGDAADVIVCDGFVGNVLLKAAEGLGEMLIGIVRAGVGSLPEGREVLKTLHRKLDYAEYGGAPLLGIRGAYVIGHGRSEARAVVNAIGVARDHVLHEVEQRIVHDLAASAAQEA
jgi:glycerol-3-phosphate acyltransferase PlsX